jgi:hypothetical protein
MPKMDEGGKPAKEKSPVGYLPTGLFEMIMRKGMLVGD